MTGCFTDRPFFPYRGGPVAESPGPVPRPTGRSPRIYFLGEEQVARRPGREGCCMAGQDRLGKSRRRCRPRADLESPCSAREYEARVLVSDGVRGCFLAAAGLRGPVLLTVGDPGPSPSRRGTAHSVCLRWRPGLRHVFRAGRLSLRPLLHLPLPPTGAILPHQGRPHVKRVCP